MKKIRMLNACEIEAIACLKKSKKEFLTMKEASEMTGYAISTISSYVKNGKVEYIKPYTTVLIKRKSLISYIQS